MNRLFAIGDLLLPFGSFLRRVENKPLYYGWKQLVTQTLPLTFFFHWLWTLLPFGGLLYYLTLIPLAYQQRIAQEPSLSRPERYSLLLWYFVVIIAGYGSLRGFIGHFFLSDTVAIRIGWETGSPFQLELAFYQLGMSLAALLAIWLRTNLTQGLALILAVFGLGAAYVHLRDIVLYRNFAPYNTGSVLVGDIVIPVILLVLLFLNFRYLPRTPVTQRSSE